VYVTNSFSGKAIRLTSERWLHIAEGHPELAGHLNEVLLTINSPDVVVEGTNNELLALMYLRPDKLLVVVYKEEQQDGFIITAFFTSKIDQIIKRKIRWRK
jgi:hypothetical protein